MLKNLAILILILSGWGCEGNPQDFILYKKDKVTPVVVLREQGLRPVAEDLCDLFEQAAGFRPKIVEQADKKDTVIEIGTYENDGDDDKSLFRISHLKNSILIEGIGKKQLYYANRYFFGEYVGVNQYTISDKKNRVTEILLPNELDVKFVPSFEYREPYFTDNNNKEFRKWNMTQLLDDEWGLWGHNIGKVVPYNKKMFAVVNGEVNEEQYCFASPELKSALEAFIKRQESDSPSHHKFMIAPNDNGIVCQCERCTALGNTKTNASPVVFTLLNELADEFHDKEFFSTAYVTTVKAPKFELEDNAGVMLSTMDFPKGVVIADSKRKGEVEEVVDSWKKVTSKIYLWDYAISFDNYFAFYPTVSIQQKNLQFYQGKGITGVFMHGNEESYSSLSSLKYYLYSNLLKDTKSNVNKLAHDYLVAQYPTLGSDIFAFYSKIDELALKSNKSLDIYGGMSQARKKYLDESGFPAFYDKLIKQSDTINAAEKEKLQPLLLGLTFQRLELMRVAGLKTGGYGTIGEDGVAKIKPEVWKYLERLKEYKASTGVELINEMGFKLSDYIKNWEQVTAKDYDNLFFEKKIQAMSTLDEDYPDARMLNDGAIGFEDYYNNWLLVTGDTLKVKVEAADVAGAKNFEMSFLSDSRHKIYLPQRVEVLVNGRKYEGSLPVLKSDKAQKVKVAIPLTVNKEDNEVIVNVVKQAEFKGKSVAADEIVFKKDN